MKTISLMLAALLLMPGAAFADKALQNALAKAQFMLRQANAEKITLQKEKNELQQAFDAYKEEKEQEIRSKEKGNRKLSGQISDIKDRYVALHGEFNELRGRYIETLQENKQLQSNLNIQKENFQLCFDNNRKLFDVNQEILSQYEGKGFWEVVNQKEPMLGLKQVEIENLVQEYQYKNEDLLVSEALLNESREQQIP